MPYLELAGRLPQKLLQFSKSTLGRHVKFGSVFLSSLTIILAAVLCLLYFFQVSMLAQKGLEINKLENNLTVLKKENQELESDIARIKALKFTEEVVGEHTTLEEISKVIHVRSIDHRRIAKN